MQSSTANDPSSEALTACPLCERAAHKALPLPGQWIGSEVFGELPGKIGLVRCPGCGLVFTNPRPSNELLNAYYSGSTYVCHEPGDSASARAKAKFVLDRVARHLPAGAPRTLLDYGAGGGGFLLHARALGWKVRGFEPGRRGLETCRGLGLNVIANADELPSGECGLVTLHHVFEHLSCPAKVLGDMKRLLAPDGRLYIEVPNAHSLRARLSLPILSRNCGVDERYRAFPIHLMYYNDRTLRKMLEKGGWAVETTFTMGLGTDEFFTRSGATSRRARDSGGTESARPSGKRRLRRGLRDVFLNLGLGENLVAIARPVGGSPYAESGTDVRSSAVGARGGIGEVGNG